MRTMFDSVSVPTLPAGGQLYAGYVDGRYANFTALQARFPLAVLVPISVNWAGSVGLVLDVENGDATPQLAPVWVTRRRGQGVTPSVYCSLSAWPTVRAEFERQGVPEPPYWIAAYPGNGPALYPGSVAHQFDSNARFDSSVVADYWPGIDPPPLTKEEQMGISINEAGAGFAVGAGTRGGHILAVKPTTQNPSGWSVVDVTAAVEKAYPGTPAFLVAP